MMTRHARLVLLLLCGLAIAWPHGARADGMQFSLPEQNAPLRIDVPGTGNWRAECRAIQPYGGIIYPGQAVSMTLAIVNADKTKTLEGTPTLEVVRYGMRLEKEDGFPKSFYMQGHLVPYVPLGEATTVPQAPISVKPGASVELTWQQARPDDFALFGTYVVIVNLPGVGRQPAATFARCHPYNTKDNGDGKTQPMLYQLHLYDDRPGQLRLASAVGYRWVRTDAYPDWNSTDREFPTERKPFDWSKVDPFMDEARAQHMWLLSNLYGSPFKAITKNNMDKYNQVHDRKYDDRWGEFVEAVVARYTGADGSGPLQILDYWNEPWEGGGISGWRSDSIRYRQLYKILYERAHKACPTIKVGGASSIMNSADKFMTVANWQDTYTLDVLSDHYVMPTINYGPRIAQQLGVVSLETETWLGFDADQVINVSANILATGQKMVCTNHPWQLAWLNGTTAGWMPTPIMMATNSFQHFIGARPFTRIVYHQHLPLLFQFGAGADARFILLGDRRLMNKTAVEWYDQIRANGTLTLDTAGGKVQAFDVNGNAIAAQDGKLTLPVSRLAVYLQGADEKTVVDAVRAGTLRDITPVEIFIDDFAKPLGAGVALEADIHNVLNREITGTVTLTPPAGMTLAATTQQLTLAAGETKRITIPIKAAAPVPSNAYPVTIAFTSNAGKAAVSDTLRVNTIRRGTPTIDGNLADWTAAIPVTMRGSDAGRDLTIAAWKPWEQDTAKAGLAEVRLQYDATYLYVAVRERSATFTPKPRLSTDPMQNACFGTDDMAHTYVRSILDTAPYAGHCVQIGLDVTDFRLLPPMPAVPERSLAMEDTDYEYSVWGTPDGGAEIWRSVTPRVKFFHFLPRCMPAGYDGVPRNARAVVTRTGQDTVYEIALPLADMPELRPAPGKTINVALRLPASRIELGTGRTRTHSNGLTLLPRWENHASNEIRWGFLP